MKAPAEGCRQKAQREGLMKGCLVLLCWLAAVAGAGAAPVSLDYTIVGTFPHRVRAFTQGLVVHDGALMESSGRYRQSSVAILNLESGEVRRERALADHLFGEGLALVGERLYQLTWRAGQALLYDAATLEPAGTLSYSGEGWGLTHDGRHLIMSDGSADLSFRDPADFSEVRRVTVTDAGLPLKRLNELEWIEGRVYANVYLTSRVVVINPQDGVVQAELDLTPLFRKAREQVQAGVANGIAWDNKARRLFVTGKNWPAIYEIEIRK